MMLTQIDHKATKVSGVLALLAIVSLGTTHVLKTPELSQKAAQVPVLQAQVKKVTCERGAARQAAGQAVAAVYDDSVPVPDLAEAKHNGCPKAPPKTK